MKAAVFGSALATLIISTFFIAIEDAALASDDTGIISSLRYDSIRGDDEAAYTEHLKRFAEREHVSFSGGGFSFSGFLRLKYENIRDKGKNSSRIKSYLDLNLLNVGVDGLSVHFYGSMENSLKDSRESLDIYYGYIRYKTFQNAIDVKAGRFELINNAFMTVDGGQISAVTPFHFGILLYGGVPYYKNFEDSKEIFRNTGDLIYGGRIFLSGVENLNAYAGYSRETGKNDNGNYSVFSETASAGAFYLYDMSSQNVPVYASAAVIAEYNPHEGVASRLSAKLNYRYGLFEAVLFGDMFDVEDSYPKDRELIIRLLSTGKEKRFGGDAAFDISDWFSIYGGAYGTSVELKNDRDVSGMVYKGGFNFYLMKYAGLMFGGEAYYYDTSRYDSLGGSLEAEWRMTQDFSLTLSGELANLVKSGKTVNAYAAMAEFTVYLTRYLELTAFFEKGERNRFMDDMRCGATVRYDFR